MPPLARFVSAAAHFGAGFAGEVKLAARAFCVRIRHSAYATTFGLPAYPGGRRPADWKGRAKRRGALLLNST